jgi:hypothetical protein
MKAGEAPTPSPPREGGCGGHGVPAGCCGFGSAPVNQPMAGLGLPRANPRFLTRGRPLVQVIRTGCGWARTARQRRPEAASVPKARLDLREASSAAPRRLG